MRKVLVNPLPKGQVSLTEIPRLLFAQFATSFATGKEVLVEGDLGVTVRFVQLTVAGLDVATELFALHVERPCGEAVAATFALDCHIPHKRSELLSSDFSPKFKIEAYPISRGWSMGEGRRFEEVIDFSTERNNTSLPVSDPLTEYVSIALIEACRLARDKRFAVRKFIDHAPTSRS